MRKKPLRSRLKNKNERINPELDPDELTSSAYAVGMTSRVFEDFATDAVFVFWVVVFVAFGFLTLIISIGKGCCHIGSASFS